MPVALEHESDAVSQGARCESGCRPMLRSTAETEVACILCPYRVRRHGRGGGSMPVTRSIQSLSQAGIHCGTTPFDGSSDGTDGEDTSLASAHKAGDINLASPSQLPSGWRPFGSPHALLRRSEPAIPHDPQGVHRAHPGRHDRLPPGVRPAPAPKTWDQCAGRFGDINLTRS